MKVFAANAITQATEYTVLARFTAQRVSADTSKFSTACYVLYSYFVVMNVCVLLVVNDDKMVIVRKINFHQECFL
jgi:hypothetical protein